MAPRPSKLVASNGLVRSDLKSEGLQYCNACLFV